MGSPPRRANTRQTISPAAARPGRWNDSGERVVYCVPTIAMAVLETAAHIDDAGLPLNKYLVEIAIPDPIWSLREQRDVAALPVTWDAVPAGRASVQVGSSWLAALSSPILLIPSVIVPEEEVALINPRHPQAASITAGVRRKFQYNVLFRNARA
jgi:RES domain-containing protein